MSRREDFLAVVGNIKSAYTYYASPQWINYLYTVGSTLVKWLGERRIQLGEQLLTTEGGINLVATTEIKISGIEQYLQVINELSLTYPQSIVDNPTSTKFIFRGIEDKNLSLLPRIFHENVKKLESGDIPNSKYTSWATEKKILRSFITEASTVITGISSSNLIKWAEYAQHYGVPTRFLDWTSNPLTTMYFACCSSCEADPVVWVINLTNYRKLFNKHIDPKSELAVPDNANLLLSGKQGSDYPVIYQPYYVDQRMSAQSSFFMVWGNKKEPLEKLIPRENRMNYSNLNRDGVRRFNILQEQGVLLKLPIHNDRKQQIMRQLDMLGINEKTLFPGLDGIGRYIERKFRFDYDEAVEML